MELDTRNFLAHSSKHFSETIFGVAQFDDFDELYFKFSACGNGSNAKKILTLFRVHLFRSLGGKEKNREGEKKENEKKYMCIQGNKSAKGEECAC